MENIINVVGAGLAGCEAAYALAQRGIAVRLYEMKPHQFSPAHTNPNFAELVCSNSLKAARVESAAGLLKAEMRRLGSVTLQAADISAVPAGGALAVDRGQFAEMVTAQMKSNPLITVVEGEVTAIPDGYTIIATGPLTSDNFAACIAERVKAQSLSFFDAAAPIVTAESIDMSIAFSASRYDRGEEEAGDYLNCPMNKEEYETFFNALVTAEAAPLSEFDKRDFRVYEGCMPVEVMAKRGADTMRFGPLKPVGLRDPRTGHRPWAVVQLRRENRDGTLYNLVGFQTNLKFGEQQRVFSLIPGLQNAEYARYGVMHRNTFLDSPRLLDGSFRLRDSDNLWFAGQITGVEGYMESAASGIMAGINAARAIKGEPPLILPRETMIGALSHYISDESVVNFQPMGSSMGLLPTLDTHQRDKRMRYQMLSERALAALENAI